MQKPKSKKRDKGQTVRMTLEIPMLMRQAVRDRERLSNSSGSDVIRGILLTALRTEMEMITGSKPQQLKVV